MANITLQLRKHLSLFQASFEKRWLAADKRLADRGFSMADVAGTIRKENRDTCLTYIHDDNVLTLSSLQKLQDALRDGTEWWEAVNFR